jgi:hypothetical protein
MLEKFVDYFGRIDMPKPIIAKAEAVCSTFRYFIAKPIKAAFVCDDYELSQEKEKIRRYNSLWLMTEDDLIIECKKFVVQSNIDFMHLKGVHYVELTATQLDDLDGASNIDSRLTVRVRFGETNVGVGPTGGSFEACYNNCNYLSKFIKEVFWPRLL